MTRAPAIVTAVARAPQPTNGETAAPATTTATAQTERPRTVPRIAAPASPLRPSASDTATSRATDAWNARGGTAAIVVTLIAAVPPLAFQASVAREVAVSLAEGRRGEAGAAIRGTVRGLSVWAVAVVVAGAAVSPFVGWGALATAVTIAGALVIPAVWGGLLGARLFLAYGVAQLTFAGTRFAAGLGIGLAGGGAAAVMAGVAAATVLTLVLTALPERDLLEAGESTKGRRR